MQHLAPFISSALIGLYGAANAVAGYLQLKEKTIPLWSAWCMLGMGVLLFSSGE